jgi:hypothetical protein
MLTKFPKNTVSIVDCGWRKLSLCDAPSQGLALRGVLEHRSFTAREYKRL